MRIIYDLGANNGDDLPYYLQKADRVIAVEANPTLCAEIDARFPDELAAGRLVVENCVLTDDETCTETEFYLHRSNHVLSQLPRPTDVDEFEQTRLPATTAVSLIDRHGAPHYVKVDIEHFDGPLLRSLFAAEIFPKYISAESHSLEIFYLLLRSGRYNAFKLVDGRSVFEVYADHEIRTYPDNATTRQSFPFHSAGPYGEDVLGPWLSADEFIQTLNEAGLGWCDIHATYRPELGDTEKRPTVEHVDRLAPLTERLLRLNRPDRWRMLWICLQSLCGRDPLRLLSAIEKKTQTAPLGDLESTETPNTPQPSAS